MKGIWQAATIGTLGMVCLHAAEKPSEFSIVIPKVVRSMFSPDLGMLDSERDEYSTNLAAYAANQVAAAKASPKSLENARRFLALALHLSPRNKKALVVGFQLSKGIVPEVTEGNYTPQSFARLLLTRGQLLEKQGGDENKRLARFSSNLPRSSIHATRTRSMPAKSTGLIRARSTGPRSRILRKKNLKLRNLESWPLKSSASSSFAMIRGTMVRRACASPRDISRTDPDRTVRVRLAGENAWITVKGRTLGITRAEFEYQIPPDDARRLLEMCLPSVIDKTRHRIEFRGHVWEVDVFHGANEGLVIAEVELADESVSPELPPWVGVEVSDDARYFNANLAIGAG